MYGLQGSKKYLSGYLCIVYLTGPHLYIVPDVVPNSWIRESKQGQLHELICPKKMSLGREEQPLRTVAAVHFAIALTTAMEKAL
jgi:hypothetical protein